MSNPFRVLVERFSETGIYDFLLPMLIFWGIMYGMLRKSKIFGESEAIYALLTFALSLFIWGYAATLPEASMAKPISTFVAQFFVVALAFLIGILGASIVYPDFVDALNNAFKGSNTMIWVFITVAIIIFFISGMANVLNLRETLFVGGSGAAILFILMLFLGLAIAATSQVGRAR